MTGFTISATLLHQKIYITPHIEHDKMIEVNLKLKIEREICIQQCNQHRTRMGTIPYIVPYIDISAAFLHPTLHITPRNELDGKKHSRNEERG